MIELISSFMTEPFEVFGLQSIWLILSCFLVVLPCSLIGVFPVLRGTALIGDAISHSVLPGIAIGFLLVGSVSSPLLVVGAGLSGFLGVWLIEQVRQKTKIKGDAAMGGVFTFLFAVGVLLLAIFSSKVDLDPDCVLYGQLELFVSAFNQQSLTFVFKSLSGYITLALITIVFIKICYRSLLAEAFHIELAKLLGLKPKLMYWLMSLLLCILIVSGFQIVGAILIIAVLIFPAVTGLFWVKKTSQLLKFVTLHSFISCFSGFYLAYYANSNTAAAIVVVDLVFLLASWLFGKKESLIR